MPKMSSFLCAATLLLGFAFTFVKSENLTISSSQLNTWWHNEGVYNHLGPIADADIRQSHLYSVQVAVANTTQFYDSFIYESIPRNGNGDMMLPGNFKSINTKSADGVTIEPLLNVTMAWTQFLFDADIILKVDRINNYAAAASASDVNVRPTNLNYNIIARGDSIYVHVPYNNNGTRFSIEFTDDLVSYNTFATIPGCSESFTAQGDCGYAQNVSADQNNYVDGPYTAAQPSVGIEPRNALLIFASPFPNAEDVPSPTDKDVLNATPGFVSDLADTKATTLFFPPGVFHFGSSGHAVLGNSVTSVYLSPGAYVKGAIEFTNNSISTAALSLTGFGVLSGEQYVYQANTATGYTNTKSDDTSLKMISGCSAGGRSIDNDNDRLTFTLNGLTVANPPFHSMDFYGDVSSMRVKASDYKQVGSWFDQTDGLESYPGSTLAHIFYHSSDDALKLYYSNVSMTDIVIWKKTNGPAIQLGWYPRDITNVSVSDVSQIHSRYYSNDALGTTGDALIMSTVSPGQSAFSRNGADITKHLSNVTITNLRAEGISPSLIRLSPLMNYDSLVIDSAWIEQLSPPSTGLGKGWVRRWTDEHGSPVKFGQGSDGNVGLSIKDYYIGGHKVGMITTGNGLTKGNWVNQGGLDVDQAYSGHWTIE